LLFDLPPEAGFRRAERRASTAGNYDRFELAGDTFHRKVRAGFQTLAQEEPERFRVIRADRAIHEVHAAVMEAINDLF
jgi:dTMP kinase